MVQFTKPGMYFLIAVSIAAWPMAVTWSHACKKWVFNSAAQIPTWWRLLAWSNNLSFQSNVAAEASIYNYSSSQSHPKVVKEEKLPIGSCLLRPNHEIVQARVGIQVTSVVWLKVLEQRVTYDGSFRHSLSGNVAPYRDGLIHWIQALLIRALSPKWNHNQQFK